MDRLTRRSALSRELWGFFLHILGTVAVVQLLTQSGVGLLRFRGAVSTDLARLPGYALASFLRMTAAYGASFLFALSYGYVAATNRRAERVLLPILDVLQAVPVLGFFPVAIFFFVHLVPGRPGVELAAIFLIFTNQAWNMAFAVYESLTTIPQELREAAELFHLSPRIRFARLFFPACVPKLVYNSIISWAGGWYFLIASEIIAVGPARYELPGLGSYLMRVSERGDPALIAAGLGVLVALIVVVDLLVWRPLAVLAERFKYEYVGTTPVVHVPRILRWWSHLVLSQVIGGALAFATRQIVALASRILGPLLRTFGERVHKVRWMLILEGAGLVVGAALVVLTGEGLLRLARSPLPPEARLIPAAVLVSGGRLLIAYLICLVWTVPTAIWMANHAAGARILTPVFEIAASVPATALFPVIVLVLLRIPNGMNVAAVLLVLTGMQWYLLFNAFAGARSVPLELREAAAEFGLRGWRAWRRLWLPALFPSLVTGSITAWGGGWNALIIAEYLNYRGQVHSVFGLGMLLDRATYEMGNYGLITLSLLAMVVTVMLLNRVVWRPLYVMAARRYAMES